MKKRIQVDIQQLPGLYIYAVYNTLLHNDELEYVQIKCTLVTEAAGMPPMTREQLFTADNSTRIPMVHPDGSPYLVDNMVLVGYEKKTIVTTQDENGNDITAEVDDELRPIYENRPIQGSIGEHDKLVWDHFDERNPAPLHIGKAIQQGMLRRLGFPAEPYVFTVTPEWLATLS